MCSYWRARLVPFFTPRGGMVASFAWTISPGVGYPSRDGGKPLVPRSACASPLPLPELFPDDGEVLD